MKSSRNIIIAIIILAIIGFFVWHGTGSSSSNGDVQDPLAQVDGNSAVPVPVSETTKVSGSLSQYQNAELGFSVNYPNTWEKGETPTGIQFIVPIDKAQVTTVNRLEVDIDVTPGKCAFPPVTTVEDRGTIVVNGSTLNTILISNNVQGRSYYNRFYSLQKDSVCYFFSYSYVALSPESKGLTGSNLTQAQNNNKALKISTEAAFTAMVKTLTFVAPPAGQDEGKVK